MLYNRLVTNALRAQHFRETGRTWDESRASGRSLAIVLKAIAEAVTRPQEWIEVTDHMHNATAIWHVEMARWAMALAGDMNLMYMERDRNMIRSCHMTPNQLELK